MNFSLRQGRVEDLDVVEDSGRVAFAAGLANQSGLAGAGKRGVAAGGRIQIAIHVNALCASARIVDEGQVDPSITAGSGARFLPVVSLA